MCALTHIREELGWFMLRFKYFVRDCSARGWLAYVKEPDGEIRLSEFSPGTKGGFSLGRGTTLQRILE